MNAVSLPSADLVPAGLVRRSDVEHNADFDITAMIDLVFMMNIYFLVTFIGAAMQEVNLPAADHCAPLVTAIQAPATSTFSAATGSMYFQPRFMS